MTDNAVLERLLTDADPAPTPRDAVPDARAIATRDRIIRSTRHRRPRARTVGWASGLATLAASTAVAVAVLVPQTGAVAGTPSPLDFRGGATLAEVVDEADAELDASPGLSSPERVVRTASWSFSLDQDGGAAQIVPQLSTFVWRADLSGEVTIVDGVPYDPEDAVTHTHAEVSSTGEVVSEIRFATGEFETPLPDPPGDAREDVTEALQAFGMPGDPSAFDVVAATTSVFGQWTLTNAQHAQILALIEESGGAEALGETTDRLGRPVSGLRVRAADGAASDDLLISLDTGRIVGVERTTLHDDGVAPAGAVTGYRMWDLDEGMIR